jgi:hypothetical protein
MAESRELNVVVNVQGGESVQNLKTQIREAKKEIEQFEEGSEGFIRASQNVAKLSDKLDDVNDQVKLLKGDALERVAGGFKGIGGAILDLDVGKLAMANQSLKSIPFKDLIGNAKAFGKELFTLATNPLFLIPALIGLIIANFDKLLKIFPGLGAIVDGVKAIFDQLVNAVLDLINWAGELYEEFKPIIDVLFPLIGIISAITDLISEQANTAEASSKRKVEAEKKYKESVDESNKSIGESRRRILVATGKMSEEQAERERLKEDFLTNYLRAQEEIRTQILEEGSKEAKAVAKAAGDLRLKALQDAYTKDLVDLNKSVKDKSDAEKKAAAEKSKADSDKRKEDNKKKEEDEKKALDKLNQSLAQKEKESLNQFQLIEAKAFDDKKKLEDEFNALSDKNKESKRADFNKTITDIELKATKDREDLKAKIEQEAYDKAIAESKAATKKKIETQIEVTRQIQEERKGEVSSIDLELEQLEFEGQLTIDKQIELENRKFELLKEIAITNGEETAQIELEQQQRIAQIREAGRNKAIQQAQAIGMALISIGTSLSSFSKKSEKEKIKNERNATLASIALSTGIGIAQAVSDGMKVGVTPIEKGIAIASGIALVLANIAKARQTVKQADDAIRKLGESTPPPPDLNVSAGGGGGGGAGSNGGPITPPTFNLGGQQIGGASNMLSSNNVINGQQPIKVFVSETDISNVSNKVKVTEGNSLFGGGG